MNSIDLMLKQKKLGSNPGNYTADYLISVKKGTMRI